VTDIDSVLQAAWAGVCTIGAAGQLLSACADPGHYPACWLLAEPVLAGAVRALRATPALRGTSTEINPAGGPGDRLDGSPREPWRWRILGYCKFIGVRLV